VNFDFGTFGMISLTTVLELSMVYVARPLLIWLLRGIITAVGRALVRLLTRRVGGV
jgi:hypothetical protein